jgi:hypothetical protein
MVRELTLVALAVYIGKALLQFLRLYMAHVVGWSVGADGIIFLTCSVRKKQAINQRQ